MRPPDPLERLYQEHAPVLFRFLIRLTGNDAEVKDILQEIFIRLARCPNLLSGIRNPQAFLFRMAHRLVIDRARRDEVRCRHLDQMQNEREIQDAAVPSESDRTWSRNQLEEVLASLPQEQRAVVLLKVWENLTFAEIAETLEILPDTAASRYRYALNKLREALRPLLEDLR